MTAEDVWNELRNAPPGEPFDPVMTGGLPEPAQRLINAAIRPGTPLSFAVEVEMEGRFRPKPDPKWMPMRARQILSYPRGFVWQASMGSLLRISGHDRYFEGVGSMVWKLWGLLPVLRAEGPSIGRSARGRMAMETVLWLPAALLPQNGARWTEGPDGSLTVRLEPGGEPFETNVVAASGQLQEIRGNRWGAPDGKSFGLFPFGGRCQEYRSFGGYSIPTRAVAAWRPGEPDEFAFFEAHVTSARFL